MNMKSARDYHDTDKAMSNSINRSMLAEGVDSYTVKCRDCSEYSSMCKTCGGKGEYLVAVDMPENN